MRFPYLLHLDEVKRVPNSLLRNVFNTYFLETSNNQAPHSSDGDKVK